MKKILNAIHKNIFFVIVLLSVFIFFLIYLSRATNNTPYMDYWLYIDKLVDKMFSSGITFDDLYNSNGIHRSPLQLLIFLTNVKLFKYDVLLEIFLGAILLIPICSILYKEYKNDFKNLNNKFLYYFGIVIFIILLFSLNQWEIIASEFLLSYEIRVLNYLISFILLNKILHNKSKYGKYSIELGFFYIFVITCISGMYFAAFVVSIIFSLLLDLIVDKDRKSNYKVYLIILISLIIGTVLYCYGINFNGNSTVSLSINIQWILGLFEAVFILLGASLLGYSTSIQTITIIGAILFTIQIVCMIIFIIFKQFKNNYLPILLMIYAFCICGELYVGRANNFDLAYLASSRYICETLWFLIADLWIILNLNSYKFKYLNVKTIIKFFSVCFLVSIFTVNFYSNKNEWNTAIYRKEYLENLNNYILDIENVSDEDFKNFTVDKEVIKRDVEIMKKYKLGIFQYNR